MAGLRLRGTAGVSGPANNLALPVDARVGDIVVLMAHAGNDGGRNQKLSGGAMTDPRLTGHYTHPTGDDWWGNLTDLTDIQLTLPSLGVAVLAVFGPGPGAVAELDPTSTSVTKSEDFATGGEPIDVPSLDTKAVIALTTYDRGTAGSNVPVFDGFVQVVSVAEMAVNWWTDVIAGSPGSIWTVPTDYQRYDRTITLLTIHVRTLRTRLYPRDDGLGHSSVVRTYPPPKRRRIVGRYP